MLTDKRIKSSGGGEWRGHCFSHMAGMALLLCPGTVSRSSLASARTASGYFSLSFLIIPLLGQVGHEASPFAVPQAPLMKSSWPFLGLSLSGMEVGGTEKCLKLEGLFSGLCVCVWLLFPLDGTRMNQNQPVIVPGCFWWSFLWEKRKGEEGTESRAACLSSPVCRSLLWTHCRPWEAPQCFCWETGSPLGSSRS